MNIEQELLTLDREEAELKEEISAAAQFQRITLRRDEILARQAQAQREANEAAFNRIDGELAALTAERSKAERTLAIARDAFAACTLEYLRLGDQVRDLTNERNQRAAVLGLSAIEADPDADSRDELYTGVMGLTAVVAKLTTDISVRFRFGFEALAKLLGPVPFLAEMLKYYLGGVEARYLDAMEAEHDELSKRTIAALKGQIGKRQTRKVTALHHFQLIERGVPLDLLNVVNRQIDLDVAKLLGRTEEAQPVESAQVTEAPVIVEMPVDADGRPVITLPVCPLCGRRDALKRAGNILACSRCNTYLS